MEEKKKRECWRRWRIRRREREKREECEGKDAVKGLGTQK
jgi:hypothetical protein